MERPVTRSLLATFIEYAATDRVTVIEWHRFVVQHYQDEHMENARRECARILGGERKRPIPKAELDLLCSLADALRASEQRQARKSIPARKQSQNAANPSHTRDIGFGDSMGNGSDRFKPLPGHHSQVRSMMAEASEDTYTALTTFVAAREHPGSVVIFEGDYGGTIYLTIPVGEVACGEAALKQLLFDIDAMCWSDTRGARMVYEVVPVGAGVAGGMGGGQVVDGLWLHPRVEALGMREDIQQVLNGQRQQIDTAGKDWR